MLRDRGKTMFDATDLSALDPNYFSIIFTDAFDVTVMSRNTGHYWFIHNPEYPGRVLFFISTGLEPRQAVRSMMCLR